MSAAPHSRHLRRWESSNGKEWGFTYWCQGCNERHSIRIEPGGWKWNGDMDKPAFSPSVLVRNGHHARHHKAGDSCWCTYNAEKVAAGEKPSPFTCNICHTFIGTNGAQPGEVIFLGDCTHAMAGKVLPLPEFPTREGDA